MQQLNLVVIKVTVFLILGILFGVYVAVKPSIIIPITTVLLIVLVATYYLTKKRFSFFPFFGILALATSFSIGILALSSHDQSNWKSHYTQSEASKDTLVSLQFKITEILKSSRYQNKYIAQLQSLNSKPASGKLLINIDLDSLSPTLKVDALVHTKATLLDISKPLNPHQFNYSSYLKKKYISHQIYTSNQNILVKKPEQHSILAIAENTRVLINTKLRQYHFKDDELAIINAMLLGQRRDLSKTLSENYASAGAIHILAVSGLHIGIILLILQFIFKPLERFKKGYIIKIVSILSILWCYAILAGLSPSVVRAVTMFSIVAIGSNLKRPTNIYNTLTLSAFILLLFKPLFLFEVGFQLSYLAVFAIVAIQPMLYKLWSPKLKVVDYFWKLFTVTLAAQLGVAALSVFYFHQFPGLFFLSNLVIIPLLGFILGLGIVVIILALLNILPSIIAAFYSNLINLLNTFVTWIAEQEAFIFKGISIGLITVLLSYLLVFFGFHFIKTKHYKSLIATLSVIVLIQGIYIHNKATRNSSLTILNKSRHSLLAFKDTTHLNLHHNLSIEDLENNKVIYNYVTGEQIKTISTDSLKSVYSINNKTMLVIDSLGIYKTSFKPDIVLLRNSPKINLERLISYSQPELIIADASNYRSYIERWEETCNTKKLPFHATAKKGALTIDYTK